MFDMQHASLRVVALRFAVEGSWRRGVFLLFLGGFERCCAICSGAEEVVD